MVGGSGDPVFGNHLLLHHDVVSASPRDRGGGRRAGGGGSQSAQTKIADQVQSMAGPEAASAVTQVIQNAHRPTASIVGLTLGVLMLLLGATGVFSQLQTALNTMWGIKLKPHQGVRGMLRNRLLGFSAIGGVAFLLLVSLVASAGVAALGTRLRGVLPRPELLVGAIDWSSLSWC